MFQQLSFVLLVLAAGQFANGQVISVGKCPTVTSMKTFDLTQYAGVWHQYASFPFFFERDLKCSQAEYGSLGNNTVSVVNTGINKNTGEQSIIKGFAKILGPGSLAVVFFNGQTETKPNYGVLGTDYSSYAVVYSCEHVLFAKAEYLWILTREAFPTEETITSIRNVLTENKIPTEHIEITDQLDCPAMNA